MTDYTNEQIIEALENCVIGGKCPKCPYNIESAQCVKNLLKDSLSLINHQKTENEVLTEKLEGVIAGQETLQNALVVERKQAKSFEKKLLKATKYKYIRHPNRIYTIMDFEDGEELEFYDFPEKPSAVSAGYYLCKGKEGIHLVHRDDLKEVTYEEVLAERDAEIERLKKKIEKLLKWL